MFYKKTLNYVNFRLSTLEILAEKTEKEFKNITQYHEDRFDSCMESLSEQEKKLNNLEKRTTNITKQCELYVGALNEQREKISEIIEAINLLLKKVINKQDIEFAPKTKTSTKKGK